MDRERAVKGDNAKSDVPPQGSPSVRVHRPHNGQPGSAGSQVASNGPAAVTTLFTIEVADKTGTRIPPSQGGFSNPGAREARALVLDVHITKDPKDPRPTTIDMEFAREIARVEHALQELYPEGDPASETKFRPYFVRLFHLAQLILEGDVGEENGNKTVGGRLSTEAAKAEMTALSNDLIEDEAPRIKNAHLRELARWAGWLSLAFLAGYGLLMLLHRPAEGGAFTGLLGRLRIDQLVAANFMLLWVGTFVGVCLSYAIRTHTFSLTDLTRPDEDYLTPAARLVLAGAFSTVLVLLCLVGLGDVALGPARLSEVSDKPMLALAVGAILGIAEQKLSGAVEKRTGGLFTGVSPDPAKV